MAPAPSGTHAIMDAGKYFALLRYEEAALALRAVLRMGLVDLLADRRLSQDQLREELGFTEQAARTFFALLQVMEILEVEDGAWRVTRRAAECLADGAGTSRKPYLSMGTADDVDSLIELLRGGRPQDALPLYAGEDGGQTVMDDDAAAREIAYGLASRARNFAKPLASELAEAAGGAKLLADVGAGSPYVAANCLEIMPQLERAVLVDRGNALRFAREMADVGGFRTPRLEYCESDFFRSVPPADVYVLSNTAHDWQRSQYSAILENIRRVIPPRGVVCIHEPLLVSDWTSDAQWQRALWMACYALTLFRYTLGDGTCYTEQEHHEILAGSGFEPRGEPAPTSDGCSALFYQVSER